MTINKKKFINRMAKNGKVTKCSCKRYFDLMFNTLFELLDEGEKIKFHGLFNIEVEMSPERPARNPQNGDPFIVPEHKRLKISISKCIKEKLNE